MYNNSLLIEKANKIINEEKKQFLQGLFFENIEEMNKEDILINFSEQLKNNYFDILNTKNNPNIK